MNDEITTRSKLVMPSRKTRSGLLLQPPKDGNFQRPSSVGRISGKHPRSIGIAGIGSKQEDRQRQSKGGKNWDEFLHVIRGNAVPRILRRRLIERAVTAYAHHANARWAR